MKESIKRGFSFGLISGIITTLGLIVGLDSGTHSKLVVFGGILTIAVADAFSDALGMHISEEYNKQKTRQVWISTFSTFLAKFFFALTFIIPILLFKLDTAVIINIAWGLSLIAGFSYYVARLEKAKPLNVIFEHLSITIIVIIITYFIGKWVSTFS